MSEVSSGELLDAIEDHLFSGHVAVPRSIATDDPPASSTWEQRPLGNSVDKSLFDLLFLKPIPPGQRTPEPPDPVRIGVDEYCTSVPGMDEGLGFVYDQDAMNLQLQQEGFLASRKRGETLGNYQEVRLRNIHRTLDSFLKS